MSYMRYIALLVLPVALLSCESRHTIEVTNTLDFNRDGELATVALSEIRKAVGEGTFVITDGKEAEIPYQITYDSLVVFQIGRAHV